MFRKLSKTALMAAMGMMLVSPMALADVDKGQRTFIRFMKEPCGMDGGALAKKHTQAEWKKIFEEGKLSDRLLQYCPKAKPLNEKQVKDVYDFLYHYGSDSGNVPSC
ncbi:MAG: cytochrome C [Proteobacteria bacterium]|nr:cytochrome C [Pseudomonadota bacterium]MCL2307239.1 cytochrome C [Pseudomonadota bacterium]